MMMHLLTLFRHTNAKIAEKKVKQNGVSYQTAHQALLLLLIALTLLELSLHASLKLSFMTLLNIYI